MIIVVALLALIAGLLAGFYARVMYDKIQTFYKDYIDQKEAQRAGVVRPVGVPHTKSQPINLESNTGSILRRSPNQVALDNIRERNSRAKNL